jgi:YD repeat-containing protein
VSQIGVDDTDGRDVRIAYHEAGHAVMTLSRGVPLSMDR